MRMSKQTIIRYMLHETGDLLEQIVSKIGGLGTQGWKLPEDKSLLAAIVGEEKTDELYEFGDTVTANIHLRTLLTASLRDKNLKTRLSAMEWVIYDWGNVRGASEKHELWPKLLQNYEPKVIESFIETHYTDRIASWSKVLAFADSSKYAIYDARVAMSLNAILDDVGYKNRFYMPPPSSKKLNKVFSHNKKYVAETYIEKQPRYLGYFDYMDLLHAIVERNFASNILDIEMRLFANGEIFANRYAAKYGIKKPYPQIP